MSVSCREMDIKQYIKCQINWQTRYSIGDVGLYVSQFYPKLGHARAFLCVKPETLFFGFFLQQKEEAN